ncbi:MAG TPA: alpha/beta hydrolase [Solirubrobacteraceae bacterium]|jgi:pimeloyl-ACP methyl ester carboxylesterase
MPTFSTSTGPVAYDSRGTGHPIVLLPSGGHDRHDYDELRGRLPDRFATIAVDWPGHGESPAATAPVTELALAHVVEELLEALAPAGAVLVGNSVGGNVAVRLAIQRPELVKALVIIDGGGFEGPQPLGRVFVALMSRPGFLRRIYPPFSWVYMRSRTDADRRARASAIAITRTDAGVQALSEIWHSFGSPEHDLRTDAGRIAVPTLLIWGRRDPVVRPRAGKTAQKLIPGSKLVVIDSGHQPQTTDPAAVAAELIPLADSAFNNGADSPGTQLGRRTTE